MTTVAKPRVLYCTGCGLSVVTKRLPPTAPCEGCEGLVFSTRQRVTDWDQRLTAGDRQLLKMHRIAAS